MAAYHQENGKWYISFYYRDHKGELKHTTRRGFDSEAEALAFERGFQERAQDPASYAFGDFVDTYLADVKPRIRWSTYELKSNAFRKWLTPFFKGKAIGEITSKDVLHWQGWIQEQEKGNGKKLSATYVRTLNNELSALFNHAERNYGIGPSPCKKLSKAGTSKSGEMSIWTKAEYQRFLDAVCDKERSFYAFEILYWTGIREGELLALTPDDFDFEAGTLTIDKSFAVRNGEHVIGPPKTKKSYRTIAISDFLCEEVRFYIEEVLKIVGDQRIFEGVTKSYLWREMERGCALSGVKRIRIHDLRHSHVSMLIHMGFSAVAIADRMGHESSDITYRYAHLFPNSQGSMADALQGIGAR